MTVYVIGGGAGAGKTTAARALSRRLGAGWLQVDTIWLALLEGCRPESPQRDVLDVRTAARSGAYAADELVRRHVAAAEAVEAVLPTVLAFEAAAHEDLVVDGSWLTPAGVQRLAVELPVRAAYLHEADPVAVRRAMDTRRAGAHSRPWHDALARLAFDYGQWLADEAAARGIPVIPARPFDTQAQRVGLAVGAALTDG